ncbi:amidase [Alkalicoccus urumqiensis]|uniref:Amidase n=1 Tax=Alkalicoccus urumqiensis TaxID=1548213 RepID=A0A2P6MLN0_ALKUR|nr:amidase [Alkalicoccus urumqiensis]PRO67182.1 amidase [Alkalicoccus urumqiensis]
MNNVTYTQPGVFRAGESGPLRGMSFALKDVFSIRGVRNTAGNPDWYRTHGPAAEDAPSAALLLENGASLAGMTLTDELMFSLHGENYHYGTPENPRDPARIPGGSSSGSAAAAASGDVDFAVGTDTGGSVRVPSAYCGLYGFRPTHGAVPIDGVIPLAPSFDTVGWMSRSEDPFFRAGEALLQETLPARAGSFQPMLPDQAWALIDEEIKETLLPLLPAADSVPLAETGPEDWAAVFRVIQSFEIHENHGGWIAETKPAFGPGIRERFAAAGSVTLEEKQLADEKRTAFTAAVEKRLGGDGLLLLPTVPGPAPLRDLPDEEVDRIRQRTLQLCSIAGLAGLPQAVVPVETRHGWLSLSVIGPRHQDAALLAWVRQHLVKS